MRFPVKSSDGNMLWLANFFFQFSFYVRQDASCAGRHLIIPREDMPGVNPHYMTLPQRGQVKVNDKTDIYKPNKYLCCLFTNLQSLIVIPSVLIIFSY